ncbi:hypothetical protein F2P81_000722 [Scophthalmus maximus]|uniref:Uncharacterized protein n=1 Tax=Scophthalmus maximus TaxID=52904 RepID=A0A6A4TQC7_SCOMX|nr:hypothetical protein F2P81_000722 [Scophthalmus maximus]
MLVSMAAGGRPGGPRSHDERLTGTSQSNGRALSDTPFPPVYVRKQRGCEGRKKESNTWCQMLDGSNQANNRVQLCVCVCAGGMVADTDDAAGGRSAVGRSLPLSSGRDHTLLRRFSVSTVHTVLSSSSSNCYEEELMPLGFQMRSGRAYDIGNVGNCFVNLIQTTNQLIIDQGNQVAT